MQIHPQILRGDEGCNTVIQKKNSDAKQEIQRSTLVNIYSTLKANRTLGSWDFFWLSEI